MNAPDYTRTVLGAVEGLRENYLKKLQLEQQRQQAQANLNLQYAQLNAQRDNAARQADIESDRVEASKLQSLAELEKYKFSMDRQLAQDNLERDKFNLSQQKEINDLARLREKKELDKTAGSLENQLQMAYEKNDREGIANVLGELSNSALDTTDRTRVLQNAKILVDWKRQTEQQENNLKTEPQVRSLINTAISLKPNDYTPSQYQEKLLELQNTFSDIGHNDPKNVEAFSNALKFAAKKGEDYSQMEIGKVVSNFQDLGEQKLLDPEDQKEYDAIKSKPESFTPKAIQGLAVKSNIKKSIADLKAQDERNLQTFNFLKQQYPTLADKDLTPFLPDLTPTVGEDGMIDPSTGLKSKRFDSIQKDFDKKYTGGSFLTGTTVPEMQRMMAAFGMGGVGIPQPQPSAPTKEEVKVVPTQSRSNFNVVLQGRSLVPLEPSNVPAATTTPTAVIPAAPSTYSPDFIKSVVDSYNANPEGVYSGKPIREVIARLQSRGIALPGLRGQVVVQGQEQKR